MKSFLLVLSFLIMSGVSSAQAQSCNFVESDYLYFNPDVAQAVRVGTYSSGYNHYVLYGSTENRIYNSRCGGGISRLGAGEGPIYNPGQGAYGCSFSESDYLYFNPDVAQAVRQGIYSSGYDHYTRFGIRENRIYNVRCSGGISRLDGAQVPVENGCRFNENDYLYFNPDVAEAVRAGTYSSGFDHFSRYGKTENRVYNSTCGGGISRR